MGNITFEHKYTIGGYATFAIKVVSGGFSGISSLCLPNDSLKSAIASLTEMYDKLSGTYEINDTDSNDFILFEFMKYGHLKVSGQVGGGHRPQYLVYEFRTDQTFLNEAIKGLRKMLSE